MAKKKNKTTIVLIIVALLITAGTIAILVYNRRKKNKTESITQAVVSGVSSTVTSGYVKESFPLKQGMYGENVRVLQAGLIIQGYSCGSTGSDGKFGKNTMSAVRAAFKNPSKTEVTQAEWKPYYTIYSVENNLPQTSSNHA